MKKPDRRILKTTSAVRQEVMKQLLVKKYNELTVSGICDAVNISRRTFYLHYRDIDDVFNALFDEINQPLYEGFDQVLKKYQDQDPDPQMISEIFQLINDTIERYTPYLTRIAAEPSYSAVQLRHIRLMKSMISSYLDQIHMSSDTRRIYLDYYVSGILELYFQWYSHETDLTLDEIREFALAVMKSDMKYFLPGYQIHPAKEYRK